MGRGFYLVELLEVCVINVLEYQSWSSADRILHHTQQGDHIGSSPQVLQDFDFPLDFLFLDRFQCFHHTFLIVCNVKTLKDLTIFSPPELPDQLEVILESDVTIREREPGYYLVPPLHHVRLVVPELPQPKQGNSIVRQCDWDRNKVINIVSFSFLFQI